jgi:GR25 family glycosyltransferase involved in LPS biosynthesis
MIENIPIYYINLPHRTDRKNSIENELLKLQSIKPLVIRIDGLYTKGYGALGCAASHITALLHFIFQTRAEEAMIFEDDFCFHSSIADPSTSIGPALAIPDFSVIQLAYNQPLATSSNYPNIIRIYRSLSTSAYLLSRRYAYRLVECFLQSHESLSRIHALRPQIIRSDLAAIDVTWHKFQLDTPFFGFSPPLGYQHASYSDVNETYVDYGV